MINKIRNIPITEKSYPLTRAAVNCSFEQSGYIEEEYFVYGTANVYTEKDGKKSVKFADAPYINRFLVRRPADLKKASGRVALEILNATSGFDIDRTWVLCRKQMMREGDVYIGITSKPSSLRPLHKFDEERYKELYWSNPNKEPVPQEAIAKSLFSGTIEQGSEMGLIWDMLTDLAAEIRSGADFLGGIRLKKLYLIGWSQSCSYLIRYINSFVDMDKPPLFDGYFVAAGVRSHFLALNQYEFPNAPRSIQKINVPVIMVQTESENAGLGNAEVPVQDSEWIRMYEIPGATHDTYNTMIGYYGNAEDEYKTGILLDYPGEEPYPNDYPYEMAFSAAYSRLCKWAEDNIVPKTEPRIKLDFGGRNLRDQNGNAVGGWRLPPIDVPACMYYPYCTPIIPFVLVPKPLFGCRHPFAEGRLQKMYGTLAHYKELVEANARKAVEDGRLLQEDYNECVAYCVNEAKTFGLQ